MGWLNTSEADCILTLWGGAVTKLPQASCSSALCQQCHGHGWDGAVRGPALMVLHLSPQGSALCPSSAGDCCKAKAAVFQHSRLSTAAVWGLIHQQIGIIAPYRLDHLEKGRHSSSSTPSHFTPVSLNPFSFCCAAPNSIPGLLKH